MNGGPLKASLLLSGRVLALLVMWVFVRVYCGASYKLVIAWEEGIVMLSENTSRYV